MNTPRILSSDNFHNLSTVGLRTVPATVETKRSGKVAISILEIASTVKLVEIFGEEFVNTLLNGSQSLPTKCGNNVRNRLNAGERWTEAHNIDWLVNVFNGTRSGRDSRAKHYFYTRDYSAIMGYTYNPAELPQVAKLVASGAEFEEIQAAGFEIFN